MVAPLPIDGHREPPKVIFNRRLDTIAGPTLTAIEDLVCLCEDWFSGVQGFNRKNFDGDCMLAVTELAEAVEADRTDADSKKIPGFSEVEEEIADTLVRLFHLAGKYNMNLGPAFIAKMRVNFDRPPKHGKKY